MARTCGVQYKRLKGDTNVPAQPIRNTDTVQTDGTIAPAQHDQNADVRAEIIALS